MVCDTIKISKQQQNNKKEKNMNTQTLEKEKAFKNISIFKSILQYFDEDRNEWWCEDNNFSYRFFKREKDGDAFFAEGTLLKKGLRSKKISYLHDKFLEQEYLREEEEEEKYYYC